MTRNMKLAILLSSIFASLLVVALGWLTTPGNRLGWFLLVAGYSSLIGLCVMLLLLIPGLILLFRNDFTVVI